MAFRFRKLELKVNPMFNPEKGTYIDIIHEIDQYDCRQETQIQEPDETSLSFRAILWRKESIIGKLDFDFGDGGDILVVVHPDAVAA